MRIGVDARLTYYQRAGIAMYTINLLKSLAQIDQEDDFVILQSRRVQKALIAAVNFRQIGLWTPPHHRWEQRLLPAETNRLGLDVLHCPDFIPPFHRNCPAVITVHDLAFYRYPQMLTKDARQYYGQVAKAVRNVEAIIAVSNNTKHDLVRLLGADEGKISVVYEAASPLCRVLEPAEYVSHLRDTFNLEPGYLLFVSTIEPRKNLATLLRAYAYMKVHKPGLLPPLVAVGAKGWLYQEVFELVERLNLTGDVRFTGRVSSGDLLYLYNGASMLLYPSLYEGFGLPPLEAMACGTPTIVSDTSSLPEVAGDAAVMVDPWDDEGWAQAIVQLLLDEGHRKDLRAKGLERAGQFSWERAAIETLSVYRRVAR